MISGLAVAYFLGHEILVTIRAVAGNSPGSIEALAKLTEAFQLSKLTGTFTGVAGLAYGTVERRGKRRAIEKLDYFRKQCEGNDPYRGSSGLTKTGGTPKL
jgi:hypothetical protein